MDERARSSLAAALAGGEPAVDGRRRARKGRVVARVEAARAAVVAARARPWPTARVASTREAHPRALQRGGAAPAAAVDGDEDGASRERRGSTCGAPVVLGGGVGGLGAQELQIRENSANAPTHCPRTRGKVRRRE